MSEIFKTRHANHITICILSLRMFTKMVNAKPFKYQFTTLSNISTIKLTSWLAQKSLYLDLNLQTLVRLYEKTELLDVSIPPSQGIGKREDFEHQQPSQPGHMRNTPFSTLTICGKVLISCRTVRSTKDWMASTLRCRAKQKQAHQDPRYRKEHAGVNTKSQRSSTRHNCLQMSKFFSKGVRTSFSLSSSLWNIIVSKSVSIDWHLKVQGYHWDIMQGTR